MIVLVRRKLLIYKLIYVPTLTYDHELWVITEKLWIQAIKMSLLRKVAGFTLRNRVRRSALRREFEVESLLL